MKTVEGDNENGDSRGTTSDSEGKKESTHLAPVRVPIAPSRSSVDLRQVWGDKRCCRVSLALWSVHHFRCGLTVGSLRLAIHHQ